MIKSLTIALAAATTAILMASPAGAEPAQPLNVTVVHTADIDLASAAGQRRLEQRLTVAAHQLCDTASAVDLKALNAERDCRSAVLESGRSKARLLASGKSGEQIVLAVK